MAPPTPFPFSSLKRMLKMMNWQCETPTCPMFQEAYRKMCRHKQFCSKTRSWFHSGGKPASLSSNRFRMVEKCRMKAQPARCLKHRPEETFCLRKASPKKGGSLKGVLNLLCPKTHAGEPLWGRGGHLRQQILGQRLVSCAFVVPLQFHTALGGYLSWGQQASVTDRVTHYI